jgi:pre-mRNA-processing factor 6
MTNFQSIGQAQQSALQVRLDTAANTPSSTDAASGVSTVDPRGYITALDKKQASGAEIPVEDIARARLLLESQVRTNVHNGPGYVALSRLEEVASRINVAKSVIAKGCQMCPKSQACWVENLRLNADNIHNAKVIAAKALSFLPKSTELWLAARDLEDTPGARKKVLRKALDFNPTSVEMWKALINETEDIESVRMLFAKSIETIPLAEDLWLAYAAVCDAEASQQVLNRARKAVPSSWKIWIAACRLSEATGSLDRLDAIMSRAVKALIKENSMISREEWLAQAEICEEEGSPASAAALVKATIGWALDEDDDRRDIWLEDAKAVRNRTHYETARAIHRVTLAHFPQSTTAWTVAIDLEKHHGTIESLLDRYSASVNACANSETLWIDYVKTMWNVDREEARKLLGRSFEQLPGNERCFLTAVSLEMDEENYDRAREFLQLARSTSPTDRIFIKSVVLEFQTGNYEAAIDLCNLGLQSFGSSFKLFALKGQLYEQLSRLKEAENAYSAGTRAAPRSPVLFILLSRLQEKQGALVRARSTLDRGRQQNPQNDDLWLESIKLEKRANNVNTAKTMMATALRECARSGKLHAWNIMELESRTQRKPRALEAIKRVENDPVLYVCIARIFEAERKLDKASNWFLKAVVLDSLQGDSWIYYMKFLERYGTEEKKAEVLSKAILAEPRYGEIWQPVNKDPKNARLGIEEKLKIAVARLD